MRCIECRELFDAYVDAELMPEEAAALRAHVADCPACANELDAASTTSHLLQERLVRYTAPDVLKARVRSAIADASREAPPSASPELGASLPARASSGAWWRARSPRVIAAAAAAAIVIAAASSALTLGLVRARDAERSLTAALLTSHVRSMMPGHLVDVASTNQHNVKPWFGGRVDLSPAVPPLDTAGFALVGGRLDYFDGHAAAAVVYNRHGHVINVYSWPEHGGDSAPTTHDAQGYHLVTWRRGGVAAAVVSDLNTGELAAFVDRYRRASAEDDR